MKLFAKLLVIAIGLVLLLGVVVLSQLMVRNAPPTIAYSDLLMIILTVLSIMITVLGLGLAVLGVIGWATFESKLRDNSFKYFATELGKEGQLRREFEELITEISLKGIETIQSDTRSDGTEPDKPKSDGDDTYVD